MHHKQVLLCEILFLGLIQNKRIFRVRCMDAPWGRPLVPVVACLFPWAYWSTADLLLVSLSSICSCGRRGHHGHPMVFLSEIEEVIGQAQGVAFTWGNKRIFRERCMGDSCGRRLFLKSIG